MQCGKIVFSIVAAAKSSIGIYSFYTSKRDSDINNSFDLLAQFGHGKVLGGQNDVNDDV